MKSSIKSFDDVETALRPYVPLVKELTGKDTVLDRIKPLMSYLGNPENKLRTIHLAGTSGKTSTAYYIASLLSLAGKNVGLTVSPHIDSINERTQINGQPLNDSEFFAELTAFLELVDGSSIKPSYFELVYAFSIWLFAKYKVDYAVIETGLGGLYDATNVVTRADKVCVLTDIGYDHMNILGSTIPEITRQKVGIVHEGNSLLMYEQGKEVMDVVNDWLKNHHADLHLANQEDEESNYGLGSNFKDLPDFQKRNWLLAYFVYRFVASRDSLSALEDASLEASQRISIPARMDISETNGKRITLDGAHNYQKMAAFISSYKHKFPNSRPAVLLAFKSDKAYIEALPLIKDIASQIIVTTFKSSQDLPVVSCPPEDIASELSKIGVSNVSVEPDNKKAYDQLLKAESKDLVITGSFYLIAQIRNKIK